MEHLRDKTILIGRNPSDNRLMVAVKKDKKCLGTVLGSKVPKNVSRCLPKQGKQHCRIYVDADGVMTLENTTDNSTTYIDGVEILKKTLKPDSTLELGPGRFALDIKAMLNAARVLGRKIDGQESRPEDTEATVREDEAKSEEEGKEGAKELPAEPGDVDIAPLQQIWDQYYNGIRKLKQRNIRNSRLKMIPLMLGSLSSLLSALLMSQKHDAVLYISIPVAVVGFSIYIFFILRPDKTLEREEELKNTLKKNYRCPRCNEYFLNLSYDLLLEKKKCPYCKVKWRKNTPPE